MKRKFLYLISLSLIGVSILLWIFYIPLKVEYYVWYLSDEDYNISEQAYNELIKTGKPAIPYLIKKLESPFPGETEYILRALDTLTNHEVKDRIDGLERRDIMSIRKAYLDWWEKNRQ